MIEVKNLTKKYGTFEAVKDISFTIENGEIVGFLGPNGAGKSTTMNMITGFIEPTEGSIKIDGLDIEKKPRQVKAKIGYMPENVPLYKELTVREFINYMADLRGIKRDEKKEKINKVIDETGLKNVQNKLISNISRGYRQRVSLAGALVGNPEILILDEPTVGLDPKQVIEIRNLIKSFKGKYTVILSSHILSEVSNMCDKIIVINNGKIVKMDSTQNLINSEKKNSKIVYVTIDKESTEFDKVVKGLKVVSNVEVIEEDNESKSYKLTCKDSNSDIRKDLSKAFSKAGIIVLEMKLEEATLEDAFIDIIDTNTKENKMREEMQQKQKAIKIKLSLRERFGKPKKIDENKGGRK